MRYDRLLPLFVALVAAVCGATAGLTRATWRSARVVYLGTLAPEDTVGGRTVRWVRTYATIEAEPGLGTAIQLTVPLRAPDEAPEAGCRVVLTVNGVPVRTVPVGRAWETHVVTLGRPRARASRVALQIDARPCGGRGRSVGIGDVIVRPILGPGPAAAFALLGAMAGLAIVALFAYRPRAASPLDAAALGLPAVATWHTAGVLVGLVAYFSVWSLMRPPLHTPDETSHLRKAYSTAGDPWIARGHVVSLPARTANPFVMAVPDDLERLFFRPDQKLSAADIARLKATPWPAAGEDATVAIGTQAWSYPPLYYLATFALGELGTRWLSLSPYQSIYWYRFVTALLAALGWTGVWVALGTIREARAHRPAMFSFLVANPMLAFMSSGVNADAVHVPLVVLSATLVCRVLCTGTGHLWAFAALLAVMLTKPSGPVALLALAVTVALHAALGWSDRRRSLEAILPIARAGAAAWAVYYLWSAPQLYGQPSADGLRAFLQTRLERLPEVWVMFWGSLGWLDYTAPAPLYVLVTVALAANLAYLVWSRRREPRHLFVRFAVAFALCYAGGVIAGEYAYLRVAGYMLQGRYLLPASLGLAVAVAHTWRPGRYTLLGAIALLNAVLLRESVVRYYASDWTVWWASLPWT